MIYVDDFLITEVVYKNKKTTSGRIHYEIAFVMNSVELHTYLCDKMCNKQNSYVYIKLDNYEFDGQITTINIVEDKCTVITSGAPKNFS